MGTNEMIIIIGAILFLVIAFYSISKIKDLNVSKRYKATLYYITIVIPILGLYLVLRARHKFIA